jgi:hypothetical protein
VYPAAAGPSVDVSCEPVSWTSTQVEVTVGSKAGSTLVEAAKLNFEADCCGKLFSETELVSFRFLPKIRKNDIRDFLESFFVILKFEWMIETATRTVEDNPESDGRTM